MLRLIAATYLGASALLLAGTTLADGTNPPSFLADAGNNITVPIGTPVVLDGSGSLIFDPEELDRRVPVVGTGGGNGCILLKDPSSSQSLIFNGGATIDAPGCEIHVASQANQAAIINNGINVTFDRTCVASSSIINNYGDFPGLETSCTTADDPFAGTLPPPPSTTCQNWHGNYNGGTVNLTPGVYCGWHNFNSGPDVNFAPGVYVIKNGGWNVNGGSWSGEGVTFYFDDSSKIQFNSSVQATLSAPTDGDYKGIVMYEREGIWQSQFIFNASSNFSIDGLIYLPSRNTIFNSGANWQSSAVTMVLNKLTVNSANLAFTPGPRAFDTGNGSADTGGDSSRDPLFSWEIVERPNDSVAALNDEEAIRPEFTPDVDGDYVIELRFGLDDQIATDVITVSTQNAPPQADAGADRRYELGETVRLDGSSSRDADGDTLAWRWEIVDSPSNSIAELSDLNAPRPLFEPDVPGAYQFELQVSDNGLIWSDADSVHLVENGVAAPGITVSPVIAAADETVLLDAGGTVTQGEMVSEHWVATEGPATVGPEPVEDRVALTVSEGDSLLQLTVQGTNGLIGATSSLVSTGNLPPSAQVRASGTDLDYRLDGSGSTDLNGDALTYS